MSFCWVIFAPLRRASVFYQASINNSINIPIRYDDFIINLGIRIVRWIAIVGHIAKNAPCIEFVNGITFTSSIHIKHS